MIGDLLDQLAADAASPEMPSAQVVDLIRRLNRWRVSAAAMGALAAALLLFVALRALAPGLREPVAEPELAKVEKQIAAPAEWTSNLHAAEKGRLRVRIEACGKSPGPGCRDSHRRRQQADQL